MLFSLMSKFRNILLRGKITAPQIDGNTTYTIQIQALNQNYLSEAYYPYGYGASPPVTGLAINLALSAQPENTVALPYDPNTRWKDLQEGEVQLGNQMLETYIKFDSAGNIIIKGNVQVDGNIESNGTVSDSDTSMTSMRQAYNSHTHADPQGGDTGLPSQPM